MNVRWLDDRFGFQLPDEVRPLAIFVMALGGTLALLCASVFVVEGRGTPAPFDPPRAFVVTGPCRWVRNPMYIGGLMLLVGFALWHTSVAMLLFAVLVALLVHLFVVAFEEPQLERRFSASYLEYKRSVNRWLPKKP